MSIRDHRLGKSINIDRDFPQIEDVTGIVEIYPSFGGPRRISRPFTKLHLPTGYIDCESSVCENGGVQLGDLFGYLLVQMVKDQKVDGSDSKFCQGHENMGRGRTRRCNVTCVSVNVHIKYKEPEIAKAE